MAQQIGLKGHRVELRPETVREAIIARAKEEVSRTGIDKNRLLAIGLEDCRGVTVVFVEKP